LIISKVAINIWKAHDFRRQTWSEPQIIRRTKAVSTPHVLNRSACSKDGWPWRGTEECRVSHGIIRRCASKWSTFLYSSVFGLAAWQLGSYDYSLAVQILMDTFEIIKIAWLDPKVLIIELLIIELPTVTIEQWALIKYCLWTTKIDKFYIFKKYVSDTYFKLLTFLKHFRKCIFNNVFMNLSFMDFLFYVPFFCTAAAVVNEILNVCFENIEFCKRKQAIFNRGSLFYSHCGITVFTDRPNCAVEEVRL
jgi:hypothetical protein